MSFLRPHRAWIGTMVFAVALMFASAPLMSLLRESAGRHLADLRAERTKTATSLRQLEDDIAEVQKLNSEIATAEAEQFLAPVDRLQAADALERQASSARFDHFTYTLSPEQKITINGAAGAQELAISTVTIKADAPLDTDAYAFVEKVGTLLPGRVRLQTVTLERIGAASTPLAPDNLHLTATFEWLSNGVAKQVAGN